MPFKTKICGVTHPDDAVMLTTVGVDAVGLNFFSGSKRHITLDDAKPIVAELGQHVMRVGVFVNASCEEILHIANAIQLDFVQLHGDETPEFLSKLSGLPLIKAFRCKNGLEEAHAFLAACETPPAAVLLDAYDPHAYGGTGKSLHWPDLLPYSGELGGLPLILAGGLTPSNVARAIAEATPYGVDTASGVEGTDVRRKDRGLSESFVGSAGAGFRAVE